MRYVVSWSADAALRWNVACHGVSGLGRGDGNAVGERRALKLSSSTTVTRAPSFSSRSGEPLAVGDDEIEAFAWPSASFGVCGDAVTGDIGERSDLREKRKEDNRVVTASGLFILKQVLYEARSV